MKKISFGKEALDANNKKLEQLEADLKLKEEKL